MKTNLTKLILVVIMLVVNSFTIHAQAPNWFWAKSMGGMSDEIVRSVTVDASGNVYSAGEFYGTADFDPGPGIFNLTSSGVAAFISKLDIMGNFVWAKSISAPNGIIASSIAIDASGNSYTTGNFTGTVDFDPDSTVNFNLTSAGSNDIFILKLDASGYFVWAKTMGGLGGNAGSNSIAIDASGNIYTTGYFTGTVDFDPESTGTFSLSSAGAGDIFILKLDASGSFVWAKVISGAADAAGNSINLDASANVFTTGNFMGTIDLDPDSTITFNLTSAGGNDIFISKLDSSGNFVWGKRMGGTGSDKGEGITFDSSGNVYTTGKFSGTVDFNPHPSVNYNLTSAGSSDIFVSKLDNSGNFVWAKRMGGNGIDDGHSITVDISGNVYTTGEFTGLADFDPGTSGNFTLTSAGGLDAFISILDSGGNFAWANAMGGTSYDYCSSITRNASGNVYLGGSFVSISISVGFDTLTNSNNTGMSMDIFIAKLGFNSWRPFQSTPQFADYAAAFVTGGYGYVGTGKDSSGTYLTTMYKFDPAGSGAWSTVANYTNAARARALGFSVNGNGFIGLGYDGNAYNNILEYFTAPDSWSATSHALNWNNGGAQSRYYSVSFTIGNTAYVGLGTNGSTVYNDFYSFDGTNWTQIANFPGGQRYAAVAFTIGDTAYVGTGIDGSGGTHQDFYAYDPVNGWQASPINLGAGNERANAVAFSIGRYGFVALGGDGSGTNCLNDLWQFDPSNNSFTQKPSLPSTSLYNYAVGFAIGDKGYVCMGGSCDGTHPTNETWVYIPDYTVIGSIVGITHTNIPDMTSCFYPNPLSDQATVILRSNSKDVNPGSIHFSVTNLLGESVHVENKINKTPDGNIIVKIQREQLHPGFYVYEIMNGNEQLSKGKFIVE